MENTTTKDRLFARAGYPREVLFEARERLQRGEFKRKVKKVTPRDARRNAVALECGHVFEHAFGMKLTEAESCIECAEQWMLEETARRAEVRS